MTREDRYRLQAEILLDKRNEAKALFSKHKPSIGYVGEHLLRQALKRLLPNDYAVCQGFISNEDELSAQCDKWSCYVFCWRIKGYQCLFCGCCY